MSVYLMYGGEVLEIIDLLIGPLVSQNPFKYAFDSGYRGRLKKAIGREASRIFLYQVMFIFIFSIGWALFLFYLFYGSDGG